MTASSTCRSITLNNLTSWKIYRMNNKLVGMHLKILRKYSRRKLRPKVSECTQVSSSTNANLWEPTVAQELIKRVGVVKEWVVKMLQQISLSLLFELIPTLAWNFSIKTQKNPHKRGLETHIVQLLTINANFRAQIFNLSNRFYNQLSQMFVEWTHLSMKTDSLTVDLKQAPRLPGIQKLG